MKIDKSNLPDSTSIAKLEYEHTLFLTQAASFKNEICVKIRNVIKGYIASMFNVRSDYYRFHLIRQIESSKKRKFGTERKPQDNIAKSKAKSRLLEFLKSFGLHYKDIYFENDDKSMSTNDFSLNKLFLVKESPFGDIHLNMETNESAGTRKLFDFTGLLLHAFNLETSGLIILDEIDSNFHPSILIKLIKIFNDPEINRSNVQLLFTSHDTNLMHPSFMRRDQFYFAEKDNKEATRLYSLSDLKGIRNDADFAKQYLAGLYGGMPILSDYLSNEKLIDYGTLEY